MHNLIFCLDKNFVNLIYYVFTTFIKFNNPLNYKIYFVLYDPEKEIHNNIINIMNNISENFSIKYKYFEPPEKFIKLIHKYENLLIENNNKKNKVFCNYANWSRYFINKLFPEIKKGLYLDTDILFNGCIDDIFNINLKNNIIAGCGVYRRCISTYIDNQIFNYLKINITDINKKKYNCGVIYYNFNLFQKNNIFNQIMKLLKYITTTKIFIGKSGTQNIHNIILYNYKELPKIYNSCIYKNINLENDIIIHLLSIDQTLLT